MVRADHGTSGTKPAPEQELVGQTKALARGDYTSCRVCHGVFYQGNQGVDAPALTRLPAWYVRHQLMGWQKGWRGQHAEDIPGHVMSAIAKLMTSDAIEGVIQEIQRIDRPTLTPAKEAGAQAQQFLVEKGTRAGDLDKQLLVKKGEVVYKERCLMCHGPVGGEGREAMKAPPIGGMEAWYFKEQMMKFARGVRGYHPIDAYGQQMVSVARTLDEDSLNELSTYLSHPLWGPTLEKDRPKKRVTKPGNSKDPLN